LSVLRTAALRVPALRLLYGSGKALLAEREGRLIITEYPCYPHKRPIEDAAGGRRLTARLRTEEDRYATTLRGIARHIDSLLGIPRAEGDVTRPFWVNDWFPPFDGAALYGLIA
jgi:hypothetical protein